MDDLIGEFITETTESLQTLDSELVKLEQDPGNTNILGNIFRLMHTIKGTCGFLGLPRLEHIAHASENVLGKIRDKVITVSPEAVSLILESIDCIKMIVEYLGNKSEEPGGNDNELIGRLNIFADTGKIGAKGDSAPHVDPRQAEMDALEAAFAAAPGPASVPVAPLPIVAAPVTEVAVAEITKKAKETAIAEGLATDTKEHADTGGAAQQSIRVNLDVLDNLMQMVGELVLTRNQLMQIVRTRNDHQFLAPLQHLSHITTELQEGVMKTRMQPIGNAWSKFPRLIRDLSHDLSKKIDLRMVGAETELDRQLLEMIKDPLTHMVRNSADHGIEMPADRKAAGKSETGTVTISAFHEGGHIIIEIADDGRGLNLDRIKQKAIDNGLSTEAELAMLSDQQIMQFIFRAGFSTAEKVTSVSGRGVGMDVVRTNIEKIGGTVELSSAYGKGSKFNIKIPLTLAIVSVLIVESKGERFALPQINVRELVRVGGDSVYVIEHISNALVLRLREKLLPLVSLSQIMELDTAPIGTETAFVIVCNIGGYSFGVIVDRVFDTEEIVVKPSSQILRHIPLYSGSTILGDGNVIMILDPGGLARATGEGEITGKKDVLADIKEASKTENLVNFLLFRSGSGAPKAVPLELVARLEEIELKNVEHSGDHPVVQYRGDLMRLCTLPGTEFPREGKREALVFTYDGQIVGLVVDAILDIVNAVYDIKIASTEDGMLGSMIIDNKTTDITDVAYLLRDIIGHQSNEFVSENKKIERHLLLVDDSPFFRSLTVPFLTEAGFHVTTAGNAKEALHLLEHKSSFDVIVSDIEMPSMDGFAFVELCRNIPKLAHTPIFAFTSTMDEQRIERGRNAGFTAMIVKTNRVALLEAISIACQEREAA